MVETRALTLLGASTLGMLMTASASNQPIWSQGSPKERAGVPTGPSSNLFDLLQRLAPKKLHRPVTVRAAKAILRTSQTRKGCTALAKAEATTLVWSTHAA